MISTLVQKLIKNSATTVDTKTNVPEEIRPISSEKLKQLYTMMVKLRNLEERRSSGTRTRKFLGQNEACEVGSIVDLQPEDIIVPMPQQGIARLTSRAPFSELHRSGYNTHTIQTREKSWNILAAQPFRLRLSLATGVALAHKARRADAVVVAFSRADEIPQSEDALFFALDRCLPIIYVQLDDGGGWRKNAHLKSWQPDPTFTTIPVDRTDVIAVYRVASEAIDRARRGIGPTLIQCIDFQLPSRKNQPHDAHCSDPLSYMESYLRSKNLWSPELKEEQSRLR